ncbi:TetR/AcrR family transcriptional regulator [Rhizobium sp. VS19-DR104.2]|uniref:TetR/AcrR family transcriptional regulator n=1 Tax=unclassified Rhizobium TaxID=2613769 RepID=UPI001CC4CCD4|nr:MULTISPECIES: TetR/AcrR family transcriptional regulator [unclassified Rhizobium]MBZ5762616.1 TetR/AcrR family transcriptional regulator [Rhizobium sp. VS19-DR96]MBZ5768094.1 TetR/AcrR family transcriptional regulator [Rhizobium sp. VS19-DR129.2]MBZ5775536.1 TetR/AcrR family transcriptional regulator [Rhizobium sp. VS19-DRK62.2]MBZ5787346.1 TetR/AcrR family transcriptional regulator [Rhizobium sp. VS19-DR121]MBZ5804020.1 TetR/AcrR family transcriptional regulator [Rhizobium sp. VS19-DR181]
MTNEVKITRAEQKARRPKQILDAAFEEFVERGYVATRVEDIAERVGVTKGTIYVYFETKEELFSATINHISTPFEDILTSGRKLEGNCENRLRTLIEILYDNFLGSRRMRELLRFVIAEGTRFPHVIDENHRRFIEPLISFAQSIIDEGQRNGEFKTGPASTAEVVMSPIMLAMVFRLIFDDRRAFDRETSLAAHFDMIFNGLLPR